MAEEIKKDSATATPEKKEKKKPAKAKKVGLFRKIGNFFREYRSEMKKVSWYPGKHVLRDTGIAVAVLVVCGAIIGVLDLTFASIIKLLSTIG